MKMNMMISVSPAESAICLKASREIISGFSPFSNLVSWRRFN